MEYLDVVIVGTGPAGLGAAFGLLEGGARGASSKPKAGGGASDAAPSILLLDRHGYSSGGLRNDCKMNFTWPIGFPAGVWDEATARDYLGRVEDFLRPSILEKRNVSVYAKRAERLGTSLLEVRQAHLGTDGGLELIKRLMADLTKRGVAFGLDERVLSVAPTREGGRSWIVATDKREIACRNLVIAPGRGGFSFLQDLMASLGIQYTDNVVDIGIRVETREERYSIVKDYYDPKFLFPLKTRTFCTNSRAAHVVQEKYEDGDGKPWYSVNGHAWSASRPANGLANFALLRTVTLTQPLASGQAYARMLGVQASLLGGGAPIVQRVGDFRLGKRSKAAGLNGDLYDFEPTLGSATPGDLALACPGKILEALWKAMKTLDTIVPGILHPSTLMYYPEIKLYANRPTFMDANFQALPRLWLVGDGAGTSRGITAAWASGLRASDGIRSLG
ncbi:MAG TPA: pyridine nucleotide-disulfide oxidoreductase [Rectinemataceae bacterium]|nr:pyridine nucleotide-disulfide oxidoreductase [Rectinemataceae bacterium]